MFETPSHESTAELELRHDHWKQSKKPPHEVETAFKAIPQLESLDAQAVEDCSRRWELCLATRSEPSSQSRLSGRFIANLPLHDSGRPLPWAPPITSQEPRLFFPHFDPSARPC